MRFLFPVFLLAAIAPREPLRLIDEFDQMVQHRIEDPMPKTLGMSRVMIRPSLGKHFEPLVSDVRDFAPATDAERKILAQMEDQRLQLGLYLFGGAILNHPVDSMDYRSLKGPGAITKGTTRPSWYPSVFPVSAPESGPDPRALPNWKEVYPLAQKAMRSFADGGGGFEMRLGSWDVAARPVIAISDRCVTCHGNTAQIGKALGGILYAYRNAN
jgi:hypothetical protein